MYENAVKNHEQMVLSWANNVYNTEFSVKNRLKQVSSMKLSYFLENNRFAHYFQYNGPKLRMYENSEKSRTDGAFMGKQCL